MDRDGGAASVDSTHVQSFELRSARGQPTPGGATAYTSYLETSFDLKRGETIVLGSSVSGDTARVVLVTALP